MIFDTDVMIWAFRGNDKALDAIDRAVMRSISAVMGSVAKPSVERKRFIESISVLFLTPCRSSM